MFDRLRRRLGAGAAPAQPPTPTPAPVAPPPPGPADPGQLSELTERVVELVAPGFRDREHVLDLAGDLVGDEYPGLGPADARAVVERVWRQRLAEQESWPARTDADRVSDAFAELDRSGVVARMAFACCTRCGFVEIGDERPRDRPSSGFVFFHDQDADRLVEPEALLHLAFGGWDDGGTAAERTEADRVTGERVRAAMLQQGLDVRWDGDPEGRIAVAGLDWRRRLPG